MESAASPIAAVPASAGLRLCQAYICIALALALIFGLICPPHMFDYDISMLRVVLLMAGGTVSMWLSTRRAAMTRYVGAATVLAGAVLSAVDHAAFGAYGILSGYIGQAATSAIMAVEYAGAAAVAAWLLFSRQAPVVLHKPLDLGSSRSEGYSWEVPLRERVRTKEFWRDLLVYFVVFSLLGHWLEMLFCQLIVAGVFMGDYDPGNAMLWNQWLFPFTAEGAAAVAIVFVLHPAARWMRDKMGGGVFPALLASFLLNALVCTSIDFTTGMISNQDYALWDYRAMPFNFMGQVCLQNSMVYSIAATSIVWAFYPLMDKAMNRAPRGVANTVAFGLLGVYLFLAALHFVDFSAL